jgi:hypothetical protein
MKKYFKKGLKRLKKTFPDSHKEIFSIFEQVLINLDKEWSPSLIKGKNAIIHLETEKKDGTEGITPKQLKKLLSFLSKEEIIFIFSTISLFSTKISERYDPDGDPYYDSEEDSISWKYFFKFNIKNREEAFQILTMYTNFTLNEKEWLSLMNKKDYISKIKSLSKIVLKLKEKKLFLKKELLEELLNNDDITFNIFSELLESDLLKNNSLISKELLKPTIFLNNRKKEWGKKHNFVPTDKEILSIDPEFWDKKTFLDSMFYLFKTKQIKKLSNNEKDFFISLYKIFGLNLPTILPTLKLEKVSTLPEEMTFFLYKKGLNNKFINIMRDLKKGIDLQLKILDLYYIYISLSLLKTKNNNGRINLKTINSLIELGKILKEETPAFYDNLSYDNVISLVKSNLSKDEINRILDLFKKTKDKKVKGIPLLSGKIKDYSYEMLEKNNIEGLIAGNLTQCCQRINGIGESCVYYGAENENSTFFIVKKDNKVVAQSWVWRKKGILCFDSIECISYSYGESVINLYKDYAKKALKEDKSLKLVTCGSYGRTGQTNLKRIEETEFIQNSYTDASVQYILESRSSL